MKDGKRDKVSGVSNLGNYKSIKTQKEDMSLLRVRPLFRYCQGPYCGCSEIKVISLVDIKMKKKTYMEKF
jgi:hypothetical protein